MTTVSDKTAPRGNWSWAPLFTMVAFIMVVAGLQYSIPYPLDDDTAYHFAVARLIREHGILHSFPWTRFSWQYDHYADKEFLFHLLFVPFTPLGFNTAARIVGIIGGSAVIGALYTVLRWERVRFAWLWALAPLGTTIFVYRFSQVRPHLISIALAILLVWAYSRRRLLVLALVAFLYPLAYVAFWQLPLLLVVAAEVARRLGNGRFSWRPMAVLLSGIIAGFLLHPNSWNLLYMNWIHMADILFRNAWGNRVEFNIGEEFEAFSPAQWLEYLLPASVMMIASCILAWKTRKDDVLPSACTMAALLFCLLTIRTNRFLEYFVPFTALSLGLAARQADKRWLVGLLVLVMIAGIPGGMPLIRYMAGEHDQRTWQMEPAVVTVFDRMIPKSANVFTCGWEYTGELLLNLPERNFMVALDPTLLYKKDPRLYDVWYRTLLDAPSDAAEIVRTRFNSRYVACVSYPDLFPFFNAVAATPGVTTLFTDKKWVLFDLGERRR